MKNIIYIFVFLVSIFLISCGDDTCNLDTETYLKVNFHTADTNLVNDKFLDSLSIFSSEWTDSIYYSEEKSDSSLLLVLSPNSDLTEFVFTSETEELKDTLKVYHQNEVVFLSPECGFIVNYKIDTFISTYNIIDSLELLNSDISRKNNGQIQIYF